MVEFYVDADACPVREEVFRVATRLNLKVYVVSNGSRPIRPPGLPNVSMIMVAEGADAADDWIAEHITDQDICLTNDIPLAARALAKNAGALAFNGKIWSQANIGNALAGREVSRYMRELGMETGGGHSFSKSDRSKFLSALDTMAMGKIRAAGG